ncbi:MAG: polyribonucleotide nucleotidyltransferase, partial [bacterium]
SRLIDRSIRPLIKDFFNEISVFVQVFSADLDENPEILGLIGTSLALNISPIPITCPIGAYFYKENNFELTLASIKDKITMIEFKGNQIPENEVINAIEKSFLINQKIIDFQEKIINDLKPEKITTSSIILPEILEKLYIQYFAEITKKVLNEQDKKIRNEMLKSINLENLKKKIYENNPENNELINQLSEFSDFQFSLIKKKYLKEFLNEQVFSENRRIDNRKLDEIRPISIETGILPYPHGSAIFTRGQTQVLSVVTLGTKNDQQMIEGLTLEEEFKRFMHHYYFPPFSVGESKKMGPPSRREIGHGYLAEKALETIIPEENAFPYTI